jgi:hypothetical protein
MFNFITTIFSWIKTLLLIDVEKFSEELFSSIVKMTWKAEMSMAAIAAGFGRSHRSSGGGRGRFWKKSSRRR